MKAALVLALILCPAAGALAETAARTSPVSERDARKLLFSPKGSEAQMTDGTGLPDTDQTMLASVAETQPYYGAIAISPDDGLLSEATVAAANYHDTAAAEAVALAECNAKKTGAAGCVIAALIRPKGWEARPLQLSQAATAGLRADYPGTGGALAISAVTGAWGIGPGADAALGACAGPEAKVTDCAVVIAD